ncbi:acetylornithine deacetylase [Komagataeibacter swingsii]|uniref:Acetylornithine deacetylase n=1 Tax=Komagataeibacter swingsii TaxID=215220 RepID=A0A2V4RM18_9PROT|nr:acetylornithine deacetylase [Komagataeibacter swingsii]PYD70911.1 acetylornithine deacetylase [Komagataeibacter swingsii]GBQ60792.1 acetylornithine deacetylase ArgE [Komagataeibacter swingsii DSM 16373]
MTSLLHDSNPSVAALAHLVAWPTLSRAGNLGLIEWYAQQLRAARAAVTVVRHGETDRYGLFGTIGPDAGQGIVLSGHSDVVPVQGQAWTCDAFSLTDRDGKLFARGSSDMKGFLACMLTAAQYAAGRALRRPLHFAVSCDEEIGCVGVRSLLAFLRERGVTAQGCIVGEPTGLQVAVAHKGKVAVRIVCHGRAAHSANPMLGCNAIQIAARMTQEVARIQAEMMDAPMQDPSFEVPFNTAQVGLINGGVALNIVPDRCEIQFEMRLLPGQAADVWLAQLRERAALVVADYPGGTIDFEIINGYPGLVPEPDAAIRNIALQASRHNAVTTIGFGTEAGLFQQELALPTVICGPGSIDRAHKADEYITRDELAAGDAFLARIVDTLCVA